MSSKRKESPRHWCESCGVVEKVSLLSRSPCSELTFPEFVTSVVLFVFSKEIAFREHKMSGKFICCGNGKWCAQLNKESTR